MIPLPYQILAGVLLVLSTFGAGMYTEKRIADDHLKAVLADEQNKLNAQKIDAANLIAAANVDIIKHQRAEDQFKTTLEQEHGIHQAEINKVHDDYAKRIASGLRIPVAAGTCRSDPVPSPDYPAGIDPATTVELPEPITDDLLDLARMEQGRLSVHLDRTDLVRLLTEEVEKSQSDARERRVVLTVALPADAAGVNLQADDGRIRQAVWNLIHNALKFTPEEGRVTVRAKRQGTNVLVEVEDSGVGLAPETQEKIFNKFFQISPGGSRGAQGLGLGLAICKEIVLAHKGRIRATSPGLGRVTTMSFTLPLDAPAAPTGPLIQSALPNPLAA